MALHEEDGISYQGRVLKTYERDERVMSDIYAPVSYATVVEDDGSTKEVRLRAHFELCTSRRHAVADATEEWKEFAKAKEALRMAEGALQKTQKMAKDAERPVPASMPETRRGDLVMVTGKVPGLEKGSIVEITWAGQSKFSEALRLGTVVDGKKLYFSASKVVRVCSEDDLAIAQKVAQSATEAARDSAAAALVEATLRHRLVLAAYEGLRVLCHSAKAA